ncbi:MAG TPA: VWA domain-containing protein, partial [Anaerolineae bacterium]
EAKILEQAEARAIYDEIVRQLRDPALLEYVDASAIQANVFPIPPHDERRIEIEYTQILPAASGLVHYVYPQSTDLYTNTPLDNQSIRVEVQTSEAIRTIYSPTHSVAIERDGDFRVVVGYEETRVTADKDFELYYAVSPEEIGLSLLSYREPGQDGFFLLLVAPGVTTDEVVAKDVILVLDTSGSMEGEKMQQAQAAALYVIDHLNPEDRFNIVAFSTGVRTYRNELISAATPGDYLTFINSLEAVGGTNISQALLEAANQAQAQRPTTIIFLTDGLATEGIVDTPLLLDAVKQATSPNVRIFAFGVGDDVDTTLLDSLAQNHRGATTYVRPFQAIDEIVSSFYARVSAPVLTDISLDFGDVIVEQLYPQDLPDLFAGSQLILAGRYREGGPTTVTLRGTVNGREQSFTYADNVFHTQGGADFIPRLWATRAIGHLLTQIRLHGEDPELVQSIVNLSIRYGIITPYTSYLIEEDDIFSQTGREVIVEEVIVEAEEEPAEVSGATAVEEAAASGELADAEAPLALPTVAASAAGEVANEPVLAEEIVQIVGSKTFVLRDGVWMDTAYERERHPVQQVGFASDPYFDLLSAAPELGQYLALGQRVLVVYADQAYEIVEGEGQSSVTLPAVAGTSTGPTSPDPITATPATVDTQPSSMPDDTAGWQGSYMEVARQWAVALLIPLLLGFGVWIGYKRLSS